MNTRNFSGNQRTTWFNVYHKCGLCFKIILFDSDEISSHLKGHHKISHKEYNEKFMNARKSPRITKTDEKVLKDTMDIQVQDNTIRKTNNRVLLFPERRTQVLRKWVLRNYLMNLILHWALLYLLSVELNMKTKQLENSWKN